MIKKIWNDPVLSKVIAVGIVGLISLIYAKFISATENLTFEDAFNKVLALKIGVIYVLASLVSYWILSWIYKKLFKKTDSYYNDKQKKLREFNNTLDQNTGILFRWGVYFNYETPFIADLTPFCTKHGGTPLRFINSRCPVQGCENERQTIDNYIVKNIIESELIDRWDNMK